MKPILQSKLYELNGIFNEIINLFNSNKLPNKILFSGPKGSGKSTLAYHIINYIFSTQENHPYNIGLNQIDDSNYSFKLINNGTHPNFHLIDLLEDKNNIEISQIRKMIDYANKSTFNNRPRFILIDNVENLNINSLNALLKIIEEPNYNIFFILIHNEGKKIQKTLKSRCLTFKINLTFEQSIKVANQLLNKNVIDLINIDLINYYLKPGDYINLINFSNECKINLNDFNLKNFLLFIIDGNFYKKNNFVKLNIFNYIELYLLKIFNQSIHKNKISSFYTKFIHKINNANKYNLDYESLFIEFKVKILNG